MGPQAIQGLLARYQSRIQAPEKSVLVAFGEVVERQLGFTLDLTELSYNTRSRTIMLQFGGPKKNEVLLNKAALLLGVRAKLPPMGAPSEIR